MKRALLIAGGTVGGLGAVLAITPPQLGTTSAINIAGGPMAGAGATASASASSSSSSSNAAVATVTATKSAKPTKSSAGATIAPATQAPATTAPTTASKQVLTEHLLGHQ